MEKNNKALSFAGYTLGCFWPGLNFLAYNAAELQKIGGSAVLVVFFLCTTLWLIGIALAIAPSLFSWRWCVPRAFSVGIVAIFVFFSHQSIRGWIVDEYALSELASRVVYLLISAGALAAAWRLTRHAPVRVALMMSAGLMAALPLVRLLLMAVATFGASQELAKSSFTAAVPAGPLSNENVYYVVLDGYIGNSGLKKYVHHDVNSFIQQMQDMGYVHIDSARSNYTSTHVSLVATFEMDYVVNERSLDYKYRLNRFPLKFRQGREPALVKQLAAEGYDFIHAGNLLMPCYPREHIECLSNAPNYDLFNYVAASFLAPTRLPQVFARLWGSYDVLTPVARAVDRLSTRHRPFFIFAHHLGPHAPYRRGDCSAQSNPSDFSRFTIELEREQYFESIACVNGAVLSLAKTIKARDPSAIVVFQADHGSGFAVRLQDPLTEWSDAAIDERSSIINLIHAPESCRQWLRPDLSPINTMRFVVGCLQRRLPAYLPERNYITGYEGSPDYGTVREISDRLPERRDPAGQAERAAKRP